MRIDVLTIFPHLIAGFVAESIPGRAIAAGLLAVEAHDLRDWSGNKHRTVDDMPYGGGGGMVLRAQPFLDGVEAIRGKAASRGRVLMASARGRVLDQAWLGRLAEEPHLILLCGHYKGIDARVEAVVDEEFSLGDYCVSGGEVASLVLIDGVARLLPGAVGTRDSITGDSHFEGLLGPPEYTRPERLGEAAVPEVLVSGHHAKILAWRKAEVLRLTKERRPDLYAKWVAVHGDPEAVVAPSRRKRRKPSGEAPAGVVDGPEAGAASGGDMPGPGGSGGAS